MAQSVEFIGCEMSAEQFVLANPTVAVHFEVVGENMDRVFLTPVVQVA